MTARVLARPRRHAGTAHVSRAVTFGPAIALPGWTWARLHELAGLAGLGILLAAGIAIIPALIVLAVFLVPRGGPALVPRTWRKRYRNRLIARGIPRSAQRSARISDFHRRIITRADRSACAYCRRHVTGPDRQVDHYLPWSQGGLTTVWNTMLLCRACNLTKSNYWRGVFYRPAEGYDNIGLAAAILAAERRHRYNPLRLTRAAWALGA